MDKLGFTVRELQLYDLNKGLLDCLAELTDAGGSVGNAWRQSVARVRHGVETFVAVATHGRIVGTVSVSLEPKFTHLGRLFEPCGARLEDLAVIQAWRGNGVAAALVEAATKYASAKHCYKLDLSCDPKLVAFYEQFGFEAHGVAMRRAICHLQAT